MIQELKIKNVLSFKNEVTFSFIASNDSGGKDQRWYAITSLWRSVWI